MNFCPHCGASLESATQPVAKCPACGQASGSRASIAGTQASAGPRKTPSNAGLSRRKLDAVIALAAIVLLLALWHLAQRPSILGRTGSLIVTNTFGSLSIKLVQSPGPRNGEGSSSSGEGAEKNGTAASPFTTNQAPAASLTANNPPPPDGSTNEGSSGPTNAPFKVVVISSSDLVYSNEPTDDVMSDVDAANLVHRLGEVGAGTGEIQFSLSWNNYNDLDLHCIDPKGVEICYTNKNSTATGGTLDHDANATQYTATPVENIYWLVGRAPRGTYQVFVVYYNEHGGQDPSRYTVRILAGGQTKYFTYSATYHQRQDRYWICNIQYDPNNPDPSKRRQISYPGHPWSEF